MHWVMKAPESRLEDGISETKWFQIHVVLLRANNQEHGGTIRENMVHVHTSYKQLTELRALIQTGIGAVRPCL